MEPSFLPLDLMSDGRSAILLGYPSGTCKATYISEMHCMGIDGVALFGRTEINGVRILGKGHTGVVILVQLDGKMAALKIRRTDSPRPDMHVEADMLKAANQCGVGPHLLMHTPNLLLMEYLDGSPLGRWLVGEASGSAAKRTIRQILKKCHRLDLAGLDHGELVDISRHILVGRRPDIIDFESASLARRPANVTSAVQCLYLSSLSGVTRRLCGGPSRIETIEALRAYKRNPVDTTFAALLGMLGI